MSRFLIGLGLMGLLLSLGLYNAHAIEKSHEPIALTLEQAAREADPRLLENARQAWDAHWHGTASVSDHAPMDEIDGLFAQLDAFREAELWGDFSACCLRISRLVEAMAEAHSLSWWNLL